MALRDLLRRPPPPGPLAELAAAPTWPAGTPLAQVELVAVDLETSGLAVRRHEILAVGSVPVSGGEVHLEGARHRRVRPAGDVGESATVHGLTDDVLAGAPPVEEVLPALLHTLTGQRRRVLLAHHAGVETAFLAAACRRTWGTTVPLQVVDTVALEQRLTGTGEHAREGALRLDACRARHGLPRYRAHSALTDALACAELFLAQWQALEARARRPLVLGDVLRR